MAQAIEQEVGDPVQVDLVLAALVGEVVPQGYLDRTAVEADEYEFPAIYALDVALAQVYQSDTVFRPNRGFSGDSLPVSD